MTDKLMDYVFDKEKTKSYRTVLSCNYKIELLVVTDTSIDENQYNKDQICALADSISEKLDKMREVVDFTYSEGKIFLYPKIENIKIDQNIKVRHVKKTEVKVND